MFNIFVYLCTFKVLLWMSNCDCTAAAAAYMVLSPCRSLLQCSVLCSAELAMWLKGRFILEVLNVVIGAMLGAAIMVCLQVVARLECKKLFHLKCNLEIIFVLGDDSLLASDVIETSWIGIESWLYFGRNVKCGNAGLLAGRCRTWVQEALNIRHRWESCGEPGHSSRWSLRW